MPCELKQAASKSASQAEWHRIPLASDSKKAGKVDKSIGHLQMSAAMAVLDRGCGKAGQSLARAAELPEGELRDLYVRRPSHRCLRTDLRNGGSGAGLALCDQGFPTPSKIGSGARAPVDGKLPGPQIKSPSQIGY